MKSRQKSWRRFQDYIPEKGTASLREAFKAASPLSDSATKVKTPTIKKSALPEDLKLCLTQLRVRSRQQGANVAFEKTFTVAEWLIQSFGNREVKGRKSELVQMLFEFLHDNSDFDEKTYQKRVIFAPKIQ